jgi:hypothetical protein
MVQRESTPCGFITRLQHKGTFALLAANVLGAIAYLAAASPSWAIPDERASGIHSITGEPFVWGPISLADTNRVCSSESRLGSGHSRQKPLARRSIVADGTTDLAGCSLG